MTIGGALSDLNNLLNADDIPCYYKPSIKAVMDTIALSISKNPNKWISVSERLPEIQNYCDNYLVTLKRGGVHIAMFTECDGKHWWTYDDVIAWMPLPKPYKAESEEE